ncbi:MAG: DNA polymerase/3'-5' exonuclease PolX [Verrucomicrobiota bacterium]
MDTAEVAEILEEIGALLEIKGENPFKCRAYYNGARIVSTLSEDLKTLVDENRLGEIKGLGKALQEKLQTLVLEGRLDYYESLKASIPHGVIQMMQVPGMGPKKVGQIYRELAIADIETLESACRDHKLAALKGFGKKTEDKILQGIEQLRRYKNLHLYGDVIELAGELVDQLRAHPQVSRISLAGSLRRKKEVVKDIDLIASSNQPETVMKDFVSLQLIETVTNHGVTKSSVILEGGIQCDLRVVNDEQFPYALHHFTGSKEHNVVMRQRAIERGMKLSEWGLFQRDEKGALVRCNDEKELFDQLDLDEISPELRENLGEIEVADRESAETLPRLLEWTDLQGTFHNHTTASDGRNSLAEMAEAAASMGLSYLGISDHSKSSFQANGLSEEQLLQQIREIHDYNNKQDAIYIFSGVECDILKDGSLDYEDDILRQLDYVIGSVHNSFSLAENEMTRRIIKAIENPYITMLGHMTGRILLRREAYQVNVSKIIDAAAETGTWIELNASPQRMDLDWRWWKKARDSGVKCAITPDAHRREQLGYIRFGAEIARKGWLRKQDVINTLSLDKIKKELRKKSAAA